MGQHLSDFLKRHERVGTLSLEEIGKQVELAKSSVHGIMTGKSTPSEKTLKKFADAFAIPFTTLHELALRDTPLELPEGSELLDLDERNVVKAVIRQLLKSSGKAERVDADRDKAVQLEAMGNVVELPRPNRVQKAAYDPPDEGQ